MANSTKAARPIRRPGRLRAVWLMFWTRPMCWIFLIVLLLFSPGAWQMWTPRYMPLPDGLAPSRDMDSALPRMPNPAPNAAVFLKDGGEVQGKEPDWSKLLSLTLYRGLASCGPLWTPGAMPLLESLTFFEPVQDHQILKLCELYDLTSLSLSASDLTDVAMTRLAVEPRLEFLKFDVSNYPSFDVVVPGMTPEDLQQRAEKKTRILHNAESLAWPPSLKTLIFDDMSGTSLARLREWQRLPQLRCLATRLTPPEGSRLSDETLAILRSFPRLKKLYLHEYPAAAELSVGSQRLLPGIQVRPFLYDPIRGKRALVVLMLGLIVTLLLAIQMSTQFVTPASLLTPRYARSHLGFAAGVVALMVLGSFAALLLAGCSTIGALGSCGGSILLLALGAGIIRRLTGFPLPGFANIGILLPTVIFPILGLQFFVGFYGSELDWFLRGQHPWIAIGLFAAAIWGAIDLAKWHIALPRLLEEGGCANVPLTMIDAAGWMEWSRFLAAKREAGGRKPQFALRSRDAQLERFIESLHEGRRKSQFELWRMGNGGSSATFLLAFSVLLIAFGVAGAVAMHYTTGSLDLLLTEKMLPLIWSVVFQLAIMQLVLPFTFAWQRRPMMALELLRPIDRRDWIRTRFQGMAVDVGLFFLLSAVLALIALSTGSLDGWTWQQLALGGAGLVGVVALLAGLGMVLMTASMWWVVLGAFVVWLIAVIAMTAPLLIGLVGDHTEFASSPLIQLLFVGLLSLHAYAMLRFAWRRWQRLEVGRIS